MKDPILITAKSDKQFIFGIPNDFCKWRANTLFSKEPETIKWLSSFSQDDIFWDVGANIGLYSVFAAVIAGCKVLAFEPENQNYAQLNKNIHFNKVNELVTGYCIGISDEPSLTKINLSSIAAGHSGHSIDINTRAVFSQGCVVSSIDALVDMGLPCPTKLKIDIDGLEPLVLKGCEKNIRNIHSVLIEIDQNNKSHFNMIKDLKKYGFTYDQDQVDKTARPKGDKFEHVREYIFNRAK